ncbi:MAG: ABC transporter ATP-binding protein [Pseudomonadota bacterium]|nr:ABC transporter ATP-binding protein [Pseudomonadota bacterium]
MDNNFAKTCPALKIENLTKVYKSGIRAIDNISFEVAQGSFFALLGQNGAGKSTTIGIITSLVNKTSGKVSVFGYDLDQHRTKIKQMIGVVPQEFNFGTFEKTGDIVRNQAGFFGLPPRVAEAKAKETLQRLKLWYRAEHVSRSLSGGMKRRLMLAKSLVNSPKLLILDEPSAGADVEIRYQIWELLGELSASGTTIILTTHYLEEVEKLCDHVAIINAGKIVENTSLQNLLSRLNEQTFLLTIEPSDVLPTVDSDKYTVQRLNEQTLEINISDIGLLGGALQELGQKGYKIKNITNKTNRVEQLYLSITRS